MQYKLRFKTQSSLDAAISADTAKLSLRLVNRKRLFASYSATDETKVRENRYASGKSFPGDALDVLKRIAGTLNAELVEDHQYDLDGDELKLFDDVPGSAAKGSLDDVLDIIKAREAWPNTRGKGVTIAIVDTGVDGSHLDFPQWKRVGHWVRPGDVPWTDWHGRGTMSACIAAATRTDGGRYDGVAPEAGLMACKTRFYDSELASIYDTLIDCANRGERIIASNGFGNGVGARPPIPDGSDFIPALDEAVAAGVVVIFGAGNNHVLAGGLPEACEPNSIWLQKSRADLMSVATCDLDRMLWFYSSRGPGQHHGDPNTNRKPDVTAPTPRNGRVLFGQKDRILPNGWGTAGACSQAAGLAALLWALEPRLTAASVFDLIRDAAVSIGRSHDCQGTGMIDCSTAVGRVLRG